MTRLFVTDDAAYSAVNLSSYSLVTLSFWGWWDAYSNGSNKPFFEYGNANWTIGGFIVYPDFFSGSAGCLVGFSDAAGANVWQDRFPRPSAAAWHHYMVVLNRATPANFAWADGASQTLTTVLHNSTTYGNFANSDLNYASRAHTSLFANCRIADVAIWGGVALTTNHASGLLGGASPLQIRPDNLVYYNPMFGFDSPDPDYVLNGHATIVGTTAANHPPIHPGVLVP